ncbi:hypothetical protein BOTCAL_1281g00010 [Botryotinia calthae]|uniref:Uncharacterized protein n=1 Tax=Botryotinia calthae TaxID=38488 RepID=A0A4Y8CDL7_9HELO|nr:hypothetical protein BOTCAL_1281g00010 [Botryotinia calthae]
MRFHIASKFRVTKGFTSNSPTSSGTSTNNHKLNKTHSHIQFKATHLHTTRKLYQYAVAASTVLSVLAFLSGNVQVLAALIPINPSTKDCTGAVSSDGVAV